MLKEKLTQYLTAKRRAVWGPREKLSSRDNETIDQLIELVEKRKEDKYAGGLLTDKPAIQLAREFVWSARYPGLKIRADLGEVWADTPEELYLDGLGRPSQDDAGNWNAHVIGGDDIILVSLGQS